MRLDELSSEAWVPDEALTHLRSIYEEKIKSYRSRLDGATTSEQNENTSFEKRRLRQEVLHAERSAIIRLRDQGRIHDEVLRQVERELDLEEQRLQVDM